MSPGPRQLPPDQLPSIYRQPVADLENFPMNGDDLASVENSMRTIAQHENDPDAHPAKNARAEAAGPLNPLAQGRNDHE